MTPKSHLRSKQASSDFSEFTTGRFHEILDDPVAVPKKVQRLVLCTGKIAHELLDRRTEEGVDQVAIIRIEQLYPLHEELLLSIIKPFAATEVVWCQEEPQNMGAWFFIEPYLRRLIGKNITFAGRESAASPAPGSSILFQLEQEQLIAAALGISARKPKKGH
jgi:2-oxoglutarate dehydrogenase E1 component